MKTLVYQSYRTTNVAGWIERCLASVKSWSELRGFEYAFIDDRLFDRVPLWFRERVQARVLPMSDLARLELAREYLDSGYQRVIWVDADVLVFDPQRWIIAVENEYAFCRELWMETKWGSTITEQRVNNAVCVFTRGNSFLDFYRHACRSLVHSRAPDSDLALGTTLLTALHRVVPLPLLDDVGMLSPPLLQDIANGTRHALGAYVQAHGGRLNAANLCGSLSGKRIDGTLLDDTLYERVVHRLALTRGADLNMVPDSAGVANRDASGRDR